MNKKLKYIIKSKAKEILKGEKITDDFNWNLYHEHYKAEIADSEKKYTRILSTGDYVFADKKLTLGNNIKPLHPSHWKKNENVNWEQRFQKRFEEFKEKNLRFST